VEVRTTEDLRHAAAAPVEATSLQQIRFADLSGTVEPASAMEGSGNSETMSKFGPPFTLCLGGFFLASAALFGVIVLLAPCAVLAFAVWQWHQAECDSPLVPWLEGQLAAQGALTVMTLVHQLTGDPHKPPSSWASLCWRCLGCGLLTFWIAWQAVGWLWYEEVVMCDADLMSFIDKVRWLLWVIQPTVLLIASCVLCIVGPAALLIGSTSGLTGPRNDPFLFSGGASSKAVIVDQRQEEEVVLAPWILRRGTGKEILRMTLERRLLPCKIAGQRGSAEEQQNLLTSQLDTLQRQGSDNLYVVDKLSKDVAVLKSELESMAQRMRGQHTALLIASLPRSRCGLGERGALSEAFGAWAALLPRTDRCHDQGMDSKAGSQQAASGVGDGTIGRPACMSAAQEALATWMREDSQAHQQSRFDAQLQLCVLGLWRAAASSAAARHSPGGQLCPSSTASESLGALTFCPDEPTGEAEACVQAPRTSLPLMRQPNAGGDRCSLQQVQDEGADQRTPIAQPLQRCEADLNQAIAAAAVLLSPEALRSWTAPEEVAFGALTSGASAEEHPEDAFGETDTSLSSCVGHGGPGGSIEMRTAVRQSQTLSSEEVDANGDLSPYFGSTQPGEHNRLDTWSMQRPASAAPVLVARPDPSEVPATASPHARFNSTEQLAGGSGAPVAELSFEASEVDAETTTVEELS